MKGNAFLERSTGDATSSTELENWCVLSVPRREARLTGLFSTQINFLPGDHKFHNEEKYCDQKVLLSRREQGNKPKPKSVCRDRDIPYFESRTF